MTTRNITTLIERNWREVYDYVRRPENLPAWASGVAQDDARLVDGELVFPAPMGDARIRFALENDFGVLDHFVLLDDGTEFYNPMRVIAHEAGAEVIFTIRQGEMNDAQFEADCTTVAADLAELKQILESSEASSPAR